MPQKVIASYGGQWKGADMSTTPYDIQPVSTPYSVNMIGRGGFLQTRWQFFQLIGPPPDGNPIKLVFGFKDMNGVYHLNVVTISAWYEVVPVGGNYGYSQVGIVGMQGVCDYVIFANHAYITSGNAAGVYKWDGSSPMTEVTGGQFGGQYIFELAGSIVLANTIDASMGRHPYRIRWSSAGFDNQWDPSQFRGAGFIDVLDAPDDITGDMAMGTVAYILRTNGLSQLIPTGVGDSAFSVSHLWTSDNGTGNLYPTLSANFGSIGFIVSKEDIYALTVSSLSPIGGAAKYSIYDDLGNVAPQGYMTGFITHRQTFFEVYPVYQILFPDPSGNNMIAWTYALDDKSWMRHFYTGHTPTAKPNYMYNIQVI